MNNINEEYMINDAIERIQNKIDSSNRNNRSFSHNIVVHTQITDDFPYAITIVNKHFTDAGYLIQHINKNDCFRVRWDRNKSYLNTQPKKRNTQPNPNKNKPQRAVKDLNQIFKEIDKGLKNNLVTNDINNINSLSCLINETYHNDFLINYMTTSIYEQYKKLSDVELKYITNQIIDKYDGGYMKVVNNEYFIDNPLNIIEINSGIKKRPYKINWRE